FIRTASDLDWFCHADGNTMYRLVPGFYRGSKREYPPIYLRATGKPNLAGTPVAGIFNAVLRGFRKRRVKVAGGKHSFGIADPLCRSLARPENFAWKENHRLRNSHFPGEGTGTVPGA